MDFEYELETITNLLLLLTIVAFFAITILEPILVQFFILFFYKIGIPVIKEKILIASTEYHLPIGSIIKRKQGKYLFSDSGSILFTQRYRPFDFKLETPFPFRGMANLAEGNILKVVGKIPLFSTLLVSFFSIGIFISSFFLIPIFPLFSFLAITILVAIFFIGYEIERKRMYKMIDELVDILEEYKKDD